MDLAKEKQRILDYVAGLQGAEAILELKIFIESLKKNNSQKAYPIDNESTSKLEEPLTQYKTKSDTGEEETEYVLTDKGLKILEERRANYLKGGKFLTEEEANNEAKKWL